MTPQLHAVDYRDNAESDAQYEIHLTYDDRFLRRKVLELGDGTPILIDLPKVTSLNDGGELVTESGERVRVIAQPEPLLQVRGPRLHQLAWHIGNRHTPCQIEETRLLIQRDPVIRDMLHKLDADVAEVTEPFTPEGGAYGHGRTHGHAH